MLWRLLLGMVLGYAAFKVYHKVKGSLSHKGKAPDAPPLGEPDTLVQDPMCRTFIPRREALKLSWDGKDYFFCSEGCLKRFRRVGPGASTDKEKS
ncbi:MAG: YHS domain-containing protein [Deltaproteobacteria bacterium]|nr:YHS domain-containing protein [Deltaproteobacteria bacterium]